MIDKLSETLKKLLYTLFTTVLFTATAFSQGEQRYADGTATDQDGNIQLNGTVSAENNQIKNVADPTEAQDVTTKSYVDNSVSNTYTQAEVDAVISSLQQQIDILHKISGSGTVTDQDGNRYLYMKNMVAKYGQFKMLKWLLTETVLQYLKLVMQLNGETSLF